MGNMGGDASVDFDGDLRRSRPDLAPIKGSGIHDADFLSENIARIESIRVQLLTAAVLGEPQRAGIVRELEILRNSLLHISSAAARWSVPEESARLGAPVVIPGGLKKIEGILGGGEKIRELVRLISKVAPTNLTVLMQGETGSGKELFARIIHMNSPRQKFVAVNCAAFPAGVIESELFGHVKGAYTGAVAERKGKFDEANGGTIFLDEIGELEISAQAMLLRVLETGELQRVGSDRAQRVDVRVIAATNRDLGEMVTSGEFRPDLFYRLNACQLWVPPLRERRDEIPVLMEFFLKQACAESGRALPSFSARLAQFLYEEHAFPGNIRELKNIAYYIAQTAGDGPLSMEDLPGRYRQPGAADAVSPHPVGRKLAELRSGVEKQYLMAALQRHEGNIKKVCAEFALSRSRLYQLMKKYGISPLEFRGS